MTRDREEIIDNKINVLVSSIGKAWFLKLLEFIIEVMVSPYSVKVLMARRFFDVFCAFEEIIDYLYEGTITATGRIVTNLSVALYEEHLKDEKILVVDDIVLHGRALDDTFQYLTRQCGCKKENIDFRVFIRNEEKKLIQSEAFEHLTAKEVVSDRRWRMLSGGIVDALSITGQPYISYLPYVEFDMESNEAEKILAFVQEQKAVNLTTDTQSFYGIESNLLFAEDFGDCFADEFAFSWGNMIRIYQYRNLSKLLVVPYVFLKPLDTKAAAPFIAAVKEKYIQFDEVVFGGAEDEELRYDSCERQKYVCSIMTYLASMALGVRFLGLLGISAEWQRKVEQISLGCKSTFTIEKVDDILQMFKQNREGWFWDRDKSAAQELFCDETERLIEKIMQLKAGGKVEFDWFIDHYLPMNGKEDERLANENKKRLPGLELLRLIRLFGRESTRTIWKKMIKVIDSGKGTLMLAVKEINGRRYVDSLLLAGEQNFACNEENLIYLALPLMQWDAFCRLDKLEMDDRVQKEKLVREIFAEYPKLQEEITEAEWKELVQTDILSNYREYYLKKLAVYEELPMLKEVMAIEKRLEETN